MTRVENTFLLIPIGKYRNHKLEKHLSSMELREDNLKNAKIPYSAIPISNLRGMAIGGTDIGDPIYLYEENGTRQMLILQELLSREYLEWFFGGLSQFHPPMDKRKRKKDGEFWRRERQDPDVKAKAVWAVRVLCVLDALCSAGFWITRSLLLFWLCTVFLVMTVVLDICFPAYFTLIPQSGRQKQQRYGISLVLPAWMPAIALLAAPSVNYLDEMALLKIALAMGLAFTGLLLLAEEFRRKPENLVLIFAMGLISSYGFLENANFLLPQPEPQRVSVSIVDTSRVVSRYSSTYYCQVQLPDGSQSHLVVDQETYQDMVLGTEMVLAEYPGALGAPYQVLYFE